MNEEIDYNLLCQYAPKSLSYSDILNQLGASIMGQFLMIGIVILFSSLWFIFGGNERQDRFSQQLTGALMYLSLCVGLVSLIFWMIFKGWIII